MSTNDILEQLSQIEPPATPPDFDRGVHRSLNQHLLLQHTCDLVLRGMPFALLHFAGAVAGALLFSVTGSDPPKPDKSL